MNTLKKYNIKSIERNYFKENYLMWNMFYNCNYNCSYCFTHKQEFYSMNIDLLKKQSIKVRELSDKFLVNRISILGGEFSILPLETFMEIIQPINIEKISLELTTNFSKEVNYYFNLLNKLNNKEILLTVSYHYEYITIKDFFIKVIKLLKQIDSKISVRLEYTLTKKNIDTVIEFYHFFKAVKGKFKNVKLLLFEEINYDNNYKISDVTNSKFLIKKYPFLEEYFDEYRNCLVEYEKNTIKEQKYIDFDKLCTKGCYCHQNEFSLEEGKLTTFCSELNYLVTKDITKTDISKIKIPYWNKCCMDFCSNSFVKVQQNIKETEKNKIWDPYADK